MSNPFSELAAFEALRTAALGGDDAYQRYRRREATASRRHVARSVEIRLAARVQRMIEVAIASSRAVLLVGPPGTGKTAILEQVIDKIDREPQRFGFLGEGVDTAWVTPEEEWSFEKLVLGETVVDGEIASVEGDLLLAIRRNQWLILDETNRADMDRVLGGVLTWLGGKKVCVGTRRDPEKVTVPVYLEWTDQPESEMREVGTPPSVEYAAGSDWRVLGTYNAVDAQRVFRMGQALSRRFKHVPVPPASSEDFRKIIAGRVEDDSLVEWLQERVTRLYTAHLEVLDAQLGPALFVDIPAYVEKGLKITAFDAATAGGAGERSANADSEGISDVTIGGDDVTSPQGEGAEGDGATTTAAVSAGDLASDGATTTAAVSAGDMVGEFDLALVEDLLAEGYLVSVGSFISKYEPDILEDLARAIVNTGALTSKNWAWVADSLHSMRA